MLVWSKLNIMEIYNLKSFLFKKLSHLPYSSKTSLPCCCWVLPSLQMFMFILQNKEYTPPTNVQCSGSKHIEKVLVKNTIHNSPDHNCPVPHMDTLTRPDRLSMLVHSCGHVNMDFSAFSVKDFAKKIVLKLWSNSLKSQTELQRKDSDMCFCEIYSHHLSAEYCWGH